MPATKSGTSELISARPCVVLNPSERSVPDAQGRGGICEGVLLHSLDDPAGRVVHADGRVDAEVDALGLAEHDSVGRAREGAVERGEPGEVEGSG